MEKKLKMELMEKPLKELSVPSLWNPSSKCPELSWKETKNKWIKC
jgi:hypothetical protein